MNISFSQLGKYGRMGNQLFEIAGTIGMSEKYNADAIFPKWKYEEYFIKPLPHGEMQPVQIKEKLFNHYDWELPGDCDLLGYMQSEKYFIHCEEKIREQFTFKPEFIESVKSKMPPETFEKETILFQIRRGDYVGNNNYYQLSINYYIDALLSQFSYWKKCNIIFFSDDLSYCRVHFECLPNAFFTDSLNDIEQLALATLCDHFIIPNSSYGWWCAWLGEKEHSKIVHCGHLQAGKLLEKNDPKDYYPERWVRHQKSSYKIDLKDCTFTIPVFYDHHDRKKNLDLSICLIQQSFDTNIIVGEQGSNNFGYMAKYCAYHKFEMEIFHRTKMLNDMAIMADTEIIANWDCDVIVPPMQILLTVEKIRNGDQMVFPYDGRFARMPRIPWFKEIEKRLDIGIVGSADFKGKGGKALPVSSVGGAVFFNKQAFIDGGMENEYMISFGPEDCERNDRFKGLGFKVERVGGTLYHMDHWIGVNSNTKNPFFASNHREIDRIRKMNPIELREYVDSWPWRNKYTDAYYSRISDGSITSAKEVFKVLESIGINPKKVIDIGCGVGEWNNGIKDYTGVDYNVPVRNLLFPKENYINCDLEKETIIGKYDLCLCLEVAEHISEERAEILVQMLCGLSDNVLFSAAIPYQGGTGHINEKFQTYWAELFAKNNFYPSETQIRELIYDNEEIEFWYKQNIIIYEKNGKGSITDFVHPKYYEQIVKNLKDLVTLT